MDDLLDYAPLPKEKRKHGHPEANLQTQVGKWCRECIKTPHKFKAFDRSRNSFAAGSPVGRHLFEWQKGIDKGTLDTCVIIEGGAHHWIELKAPGKVIDPRKDAAQLEEIAGLRALRIHADWTNSVQGYARLLQGWGIALYPLAMVRAEDLDRLLAGAAMRKAAKAPRSYRPRKPPTTAAGLRFGRIRDGLQVKR